MKSMQRLAFPVVTAYLWVMMVLFGAIVLETFMVCLPERLRRPARIARARDGFLERQGTERFFPPLGFLSWVFGAASLVLCWRVKAARWWILFSQAMLVCDTSR